ncbi:MAG: carboxypeptidase-like regulatory domain-containing protein, partial [Acidobacteria bacterium]|nr:carboxypeptidase-like regulatory domain-containing protein [Acidobacteriota bacterium]
MYTARSILLFLALGVSTGLLSAQPITLSGHVVDSDGEPASGLEIRLLPILSAYEAARLDLSGGEVAAVAEALSGVDGSFELVAPELGFWRVVAATPGSLPMTLAFDGEPLLESLTLPTLALRPAEPVKVEVVYPDGSPAPGAWIQTLEKERARSRRQQSRWVAYRPAIRSNEAGRATVFEGPDATLEFVAWLPTHVTPDRTTARAGRARLRLKAATARRLLLVDAVHRPASHVVVQSSRMRWPATQSDAEGIATIYALDATTKLTLVVPDGRAIRLQLEAGEGIESPLAITVPDPLRAEGQVLDSSDRRAISGAFVFPAHDSGRMARTGPDGAFRLVVGESDGSLTAAAVGYLPQTERLGLAGESSSLLLRRATDLSGRVIDSAGNPVHQAQVHAGIYFDGVGNHSFDQPERHARSNTDGDFTLARLASNGSYSITARKRGFAPTEEIVRNPLDREVQGGLTLVLEPGTGVTGRLVDAEGTGVGGAVIEMRRDLGHGLGVNSPAFANAAGVFTFQVASDPGGRFSIHQAPAGRFSLTVEAPGFARRDILGLEIGEGETNLDLGTITLEPGVSLRGRIVDPDGVPLAEARIRLEERTGGLARFLLSPGDDPEAISGVDGLFVVADRRQGELLTLHVERAGYADREVPGVEIEPAALVEIVLQPAVNVRGRVISPEGDPVHGATVMLVHGGG